MRRDIDALVEVSLTDRIGAACQLTDRSNDGAGQVPGHKDGDPQGDQRDQQHDPAGAGGLIARPTDSHPGELEMSIADAGGQGHRPTQNRVGLLVVLDQGIAFRRDGEHAVRGLSIRAQLFSQRCGQLTLIVWPEHVEQVSHRSIDNSALASQHLRSPRVARQDEQDRIVFAFERTGEPRGDGRDGLALPDRVGHDAAQASQREERPHAGRHSRQHQQARRDHESETKTARDHDAHIKP